MAARVQTTPRSMGLEADDPEVPPRKLAFEEVCFTPNKQTSVA